MFHLVNVSNVPVNFADFGMSPVSEVNASKMNSCKNVVIAVADTSDVTLALLKIRRGFQFYHPEFQAYCLMLNRKEVWSLQATIDYIVDIQESKALSKYCQREAEAYTRELVSLYNQANKLVRNSLPDFGTQELVDYLHSHISERDYHSAGKLMHYEKDHFYKFDKMSDFLNPDDVYTDSDNRIVWSTTKDRLGTHYIATELEDLLREFIAEQYLVIEEPVDATSSEDTFLDAVRKDITAYSKVLSNGDPLTDKEMIEFANLINLHRDIFNEICTSLSIEFKLR